MHEPVLLPDVTLFIQLGIFFACYFVLKFLVFKPYLALLNHRREKTIGLREKAVAASERTEKLRADYETFMRAERKKVAGWTDEERKKVSDEERRIVQEARDQVATDLAALRTRVATEVERARRELMPSVAEFSSQIASKLVGHKVRISPTTAEAGKSPSTEPTVTR